MPRPRKLWFSLLTFVTYLGQTDFQTGSGYSGNAANHYKQAEWYAEQNLRHCGLSTVCCMDQRIFNLSHLYTPPPNELPTMCPACAMIDSDKVKEFIILD